MFTNYKYVVTDNKVIALSTFGGKTVRGVAKCHPADVFDENFGKKLAAARCNQKVARKRYERAKAQYNTMAREAAEFNKRADKTLQYLRDAAAADAEAHLEVMRLRHDYGKGTVENAE